MKKTAHGRRFYQQYWIPGIMIRRRRTRHITWEDLGRAVQARCNNVLCHWARIHGLSRRGRVLTTCYRRLAVVTQSSCFAIVKSIGSTQPPKPPEPLGIQPRFSSPRLRYSVLYWCIMCYNTLQYFRYPGGGWTEGNRTILAAVASRRPVNMDT